MILSTTSVCFTLFVHSLHSFVISKVSVQIELISLTNTTLVCSFPSDLSDNSKCQNIFAHTVFDQSHKILGSSFFLALSEVYFGFSPKGGGQ